MAIKPISASNSGSMHTVPTWHGIEKAGQVYKEGTPLLNDSGTLTEDDTDPDNILGIALADASGVTGADVPFVPALPGIEFDITVDDALADGNAPGTGSLAQTDCWGAFGLAKDGATDLYYLDQDETGNPRVLVVGFVDDPGTVNGRVRVVFLNDKTAFVA